jgi:Dyp-type peroxidase family
VSAPDPGALQATILKGHGRNFAAHAFLRGLRAADLRRLVERLGITSAADQDDASARWRADPTFRSPPVHVVALSAKGLAALEVGRDVLPDADAFWEGMAARAARLGDPPAPGWPPAATDAEVLVVLADDSERVLEADLDRLREVVPGAEVHVEWGQTIRRSGAGATTYEPFGYVDGISNPELVLSTGWSSSTAIWWKSTFPPEQVLVGWGGGDPSERASFLVFRKLQQHPERFRAAVADAARAAGTSATEAGSLLVGRYPDGTPRAEATPGSWNDFTYALDPDGVRCPVTAHIRAVNPRTTVDRRHLIARRGMPYRSPDGEDVGLLFLAYMADIEQQFEWMQRRANDAGDRIAGQATGAALVSLRGGGYFVVPPVRFFARL